MGDLKLKPKHCSIGEFYINQEYVTFFRPTTAFDLWLDANNSKLKEDNPELTEEDLHKFATDQFRQLARDERQVPINTIPIISSVHGLVFPP